MASLKSSIRCVIEQLVQCFCITKQEFTLAGVRQGQSLSPWITQLKWCSLLDWCHLFPTAERLDSVLVVADHLLYLVVWCPALVLSETFVPQGPEFVDYSVLIHLHIATISWYVFLCLVFVCFVCFFLSGWSWDRDFSVQPFVKYCLFPWAHFETRQNETVIVT